MRQDIATVRATSTTRKKHRVRKLILPSLVVLVALLVAARVAMPWYLQRYVNRVLDRSPDYDGRVGEIDVHLWRGAYSIHNLKIVKNLQAVPVPFFEGKRVDFSLSWKALAKGALRGKIVMDEPRLNFVHGPTEDETQTGADQPWLSIINDLYPFRIDRTEVHKGEVHFEAFHKDPNVDVYLTDVEATLENLTNIEDKADPLQATMKVRATAMESGTFELDLSLDPQAHRPTFDVAMRLLQVDVNRLNSLARGYGDFDFERGQFDLVVELAAREGQLLGYAKPLFRHVKVISLKDLREDNPLEVFWEALVGVVGEVFQNQPRDQFGTRITIRGEIDNPKTSILEIIGNVLRNAFIRAYLPRIEGRIAPRAVEPEKDEGGRK